MSKFVQPWVAGILAVGTMSVGGMTVAHYSQQSNGKKAEVCVANNDHANNCHTKPNPGKNVKGGIVEREASLHASNVQLVCPECGVQTRVARKVLGDGRKVRICRKCEGVVDK